MKLGKISPMGFRIFIIAVMLFISALAVFQRQNTALAGSRPDLDAAVAEFVAANRAFDAAGMTDFMVEDVKTMYPAGNFWGQQANLDVWTFVFTVWEDAGMTVDEVVVADSKDVAYVWGRWAVQEPGNVRDGGFYVMTWVYTPDGWKITSWICALDMTLDFEVILNP